MFTESVTRLYLNLPVVGPKFVETVEGMKCVKYLGMLLVTMQDPGGEEAVIDGTLGLLDIERLERIFVCDRSTTITGVWKRMAKVEDKRLVVAIQAVVDWGVDPVHAACFGMSPWEKMRGIEDWRRDILDF